jgi:DNA-binding NarL/FixJ family response regulator
VVIFSGRDEPLLAQAALDAGARGYLLKPSPTGWLRVQIAAAATGRLVVDDRLGLTRQPPSGFDLRDLFGLSRREREVLDEIVLGLDNQAIAGRLWIAEATVKSHVKSIRRKLGARDRAHAVAIALGTGAVHLPAPRQDLVR